MLVDVFILITGQEITPSIPPVHSIEESTLLSVHGVTCH